MFKESSLFRNFDHESVTLVHFALLLMLCQFVRLMHEAHFFLGDLQILLQALKVFRRQTQGVLGIFQSVLAFFHIFLKQSQVFGFRFHQLRAFEQKNDVSTDL